MKNKLLFFLLLCVMFIPMLASAAPRWEKVTSTAKDDVSTTAVQLQGSDLACYSFAIWEETKTMEVNVWLGNTYTAEVFNTTILPDEILEINYYDVDLTNTGIYVSTTATSKVNYLSRIQRGW